VTRLRGIRPVLTTFVLVGVMAACGGGRQPMTSATPPSSPPAVEERWIGVIDVATDPNDLDALTQRMLDPLGPALIVAPVDCFRGLPDRVRDGYLIGAVGDARQEVERIVNEAGEEVAFSAHVTIVCTD
jgi:hypothetical protein